MRRRKLYPIYLFILMAMCATIATPSEARTTVEKEIEIGRKAAQEIEERFPITENKQWLADIDRMGKQLAANVKRKEIPYSFKIIKEEVRGRNEIDAFSLPGGPVYFSERMWRLLSEEERYGVLAHEIAHIDKRHAIDTMSENQKRGLIAIAVLIITGASNSWWEAADVANSLYTLKYSRKREKEADMMGIDLCIAAKVSPAGLVTAMKKIHRLEEESGGGPPRIISSHPETEDRIKYLTERTLELGIKPEALEPKYKDEPTRFGDVVSRKKDGKTVTVTTTRPLAVNEVVWIKKPLWDDESKSMAPLPIAKATAVTAGNDSEVTVSMEPGFEFIDIEKGDGIYAIPPPEPIKINITESR